MALERVVYRSGLLESHCGVYAPIKPVLEVRALEQEDRDTYGSSERYYEKIGPHDFLLNLQICIYRFLLNICSIFYEYGK